MKPIFFLASLLCSLGTSQAAIIDISGKVSDNQNNPITGAKIRLERAGITAYTLADGTFRISEIAANNTAIQSLPLAYFIHWNEGSLTFNLKANEKVQVQIFNLHGQKQFEQGFEFASAGLQKINLQGNLISGWSYVQVKISNQIATFATIQNSNGTYQSTPIHAVSAQKIMAKSAQNLAASLDSITVNKVMYTPSVVQVSNYVQNLTNTIVLQSDNVSSSVLNATSTDSLYIKGVQLHDTKSYNQAIANLEAYLTRPNITYPSEATYYIADSRYQALDYANSLNGFQKVLSSWPTSSKASAAQLGIAKVWMIYSYRDSLNYPTARSEFQKVLANYPSSPEVAEATQSIGETQYFQSDYANAEIQFRKVLTSYPTSPFYPTALYYLGRVQMQNSLYDSAMVQFNKILTQYGTSVKADNAAYSLAKCYYFKTPADYATALTKFSSFRTQYPTSSYQDESYSYTSKIYVKQNNCVKAKAELATYSSLFPASLLLGATTTTVTATCP